MNSSLPKVSVINLGCARNLVDAQIILGRLRSRGYPVCESGQAHTVIINTCCFIETARQETIDTILDVLDLKREGRLSKVILAGCLVQRYGRELLAELKDIDALVGVPLFVKDRVQSQVALTPRHYAYVKICEGCQNCCSYCIIPKLKGPLTSRTIPSLVDELRELDKCGVKEAILIGQDTSAYGIDLYGRPSLAVLLKELSAAVKDIARIRLLYLFPSRITDDLLATIASGERICKYVDLPLQHINSRILKAMHRPSTTDAIKRLIEKIRKKVPGVCLRSSFIVGFPGETDGEFEELLGFIRDVRFDRLGAFIYSREEDTVAYHIKPQIPAEVKQARYDLLMKEQQTISRRLQEDFVGKTVEVLIDERLPNEENIYSGRTEADAPEVDGQVFVSSSRALQPGDFVRARITDSTEYDLHGTVQ